MTTQPSPEPRFLSHDQINSAVLTLRAWSSQPWTDEDAHVWRNILRSYRVGELAAALDAWQRTAGGRYRPRPGDLSPFLVRPNSPSPYKDYVAPEEEPRDLDIGREFIKEIRASMSKVRESDGG